MFEATPKNISVFADLSLDGMAIASRDGRFVWINAPFSRILGRTVEELTGAPFLELIHPEDLESVADELAALVQTGEPSRGFIARFIRSDSYYVPLEITAQLNPDSGLVYAIVRDVSATFARYKKLESTNAELEQFAHIAAHDLQEPLRMISSFMSLLKEEAAGLLPKEPASYLDIVVQSADRMRELIIELLAYSKAVRSDDLSQMVDLDPIIRNAILPLEARIAETKTVIVVDPLPTVFAEEVGLHHIFQNLLSNAIKFAADDNPRVEVGVHETGTNDVTVFVRDNGIGFKPEFADQIFLMFQRLHTSAEFEGNGVGLAICERIVQRCHGKIWAESEGEGATFFVTLPTVEVGDGLSETSWLS